MFDEHADRMIENLKKAKEQLEKEAKVIDMTRRLKDKKDKDPKAIDRKQIERATRKRTTDPLHQEVDPSRPVMRGQSLAGIKTRRYQKDPEGHKEDKAYGGGAYQEHKDVLSSLKRQPKPKLTKEEMSFSKSGQWSLK
jgi:hypothetical protein